MMKVEEFVRKIRDIADNHKTLYVLGCIGAPLTNAMKERMLQAYAYNRSSARTAKIRAATPDTFGFDCVCLIKSVLWGWEGDRYATYGGAKYASNGVPDYGADMTISLCSGVTSDFSTIKPGEAVWLPGHIGVYVGDGLVVECTPIWADGVQYTALKNVGEVEGYPSRAWTRHGRLPWVDYTVTPTKTAAEIALEVLEGRWGNGDERRRKLLAAGYDPDVVQALVNDLIAAAQRVKGDVDGDGQVTAADARLALRAAVGLESLSEAQIAAGDIDGDGKLTAADAREILRQAVGLE